MIGKELPNGAILISMRHTENSIIVLCYWENQYVTWMCSNEGAYDTYCGHYFSIWDYAYIDDAFQAAYEDYRRRGN